MANGTRSWGFKGIRSLFTAADAPWWGEGARPSGHHSRCIVLPGLKEGDVEPVRATGVRNPTELVLQDMVPT